MIATSDPPSPALVTARKLALWGITAFPIGPNHARAMRWTVGVEVPAWALNDEPGDPQW